MLFGIRLIREQLLSILRSHIISYFTSHRQSMKGPLSFVVKGTTGNANRARVVFLFPLSTILEFIKKIESHTSKTVISPKNLFKNSDFVTFLPIQDTTDDDHYNNY